MLNYLSPHAVVLRMKVSDRRSLELVVVLMQQGMELVDAFLQTLQVGDRHCCVSVVLVLVCNKRRTCGGYRQVHLCVGCLLPVVCSECSHFSFRSCI